ncbi:hypothetical protein D8B26_007032 [Coccidioides posadasii str. Silveira]|uniref:uncharacterized protein n=1 Tax=Coccidioides posadasii (strain RMSCC 757 / Silveira) TaxID=443226 RepID=UPI001BF16EB8|nr:hypothetical protein D8B26_007032 [Coccidioides posadasii str. Silveira]
MGLVQAGSEWIEPLLLRNPPPTVERRRRRGSRASRSLAEPFELRSSTLGSLGNVRLAEPGLDLEGTAGCASAHLHSTWRMPAARLPSACQKNKKKKEKKMAQ